MTLDQRLERIEQRLDDIQYAIHVLMDALAEEDTEGEDFDLDGNLFQKPNGQGGTLS